MSYYSRGHTTTFAGYPVIEWQPDMTELENSASSAVAIRLSWNDYETGGTWVDRFQSFIKLPGAGQIPALIIGAWDFEMSTTVDPIVEVIAAHRDKLPALKALFVGDIHREENEISWIEQGDVSPLLNAFSDLEHLVIRGANNLQLGMMDMPKLKYLRLESGGLPREVVQDIGRGNFPALETLILWLGTTHYGATTTIADLQPFYECKRMPQLKHLGLCNSDIVDNIATFIATAPVLERLETLDLSMGELTDAGGLALLKSPMIHHLKHLNLEHNYFSDAMLNKLREIEQSGMAVNLEDAQGDDAEWRFVAVGE